ncbi:MAG: helix-turn-helix transcriptional regulator [Oscillospiraceae bacterium]|nr:helix-turn-helix transcriptional regulator [Oscillospiraceae bacterium]
MDQKKIGSFLKNLRKGKGLTQEQLAEQFNVSARTISRWETGSNMPDLSLLVELADFYDVDIREIIDGERKGEIMNMEEKETLTKVADYADNEKNVLLKRLRIFSIIGLCSLVGGLIMLAVGENDNLPVYDYIMGIMFGLAGGALITTIFYSTGILTAVRKNESAKRLSKIIATIAATIAIAIGVIMLIVSIVFPT